MVSFIVNEGQQTAGEISQKTNEDFSLEKLKLVQSLKETLRAEYAAASKKKETEVAIQRSSAVNQARLAKIEARHQCIELLSTECGKKLGTMTGSSGGEQYRQILISLIVQGALKLAEPTVAVKARAADANIVRSVLDAAAQKYSQVIKEATGTNLAIKLTLDSASLPAGCLGGVSLSCQGGSISVDNTLDARLNLCLEAERPALRKMLFAK